MMKLTLATTTSLLFLFASVSNAAVEPCDVDDPKNEAYLCVRSIGPDAGSIGCCWCGSFGGRGERFFVECLADGEVPANIGFPPDESPTPFDTEKCGNDANVIENTACVAPP